MIRPARARLAIVGNADNRRVTLFAAAAQAAGWPPPRVLPWLEVLTRGPVFDADELVRIESPGEDAEVDRLLRAAAEPAPRGEIVGLAAWYAGFGGALRAIHAAAVRSGAVVLGDPDEILTMCDKRACHRLLDAAGLPVPAALRLAAGDAEPRPVAGYADLRAAMATAGWDRVFVKPAHGSSASGVVALAVRGSRVRATTSVELAGRRLFNSLRVRKYQDEAAVRTIVDTLAPDGLHVERWFPKADLGGRTVDLRVVVIGGRATHVVVRASAHPMTNLHLGGARGDLDALRRAAGPAYERALATCEAVARCFPRSPHVGVDLMFSPGWQRHAVAEVNAFGDLLPGLHVNGRDTYAEELEVLAGASV